VFAVDGADLGGEVVVGLSSLLAGWLGGEPLR
jgi:hypothetical protein